ncbi:hypothetical protein G2W53_008502 [Senna tora]|uniref:Uncharacterized protein n=1 Tax=Senna tora TaxID=362788 RepID=A0A834X8L2_9FABA|nr:hypothetical protein G2W53_008502 [Senna tora]
MYNKLTEISNLEDPFSIKSIIFILGHLNFSTPNFHLLLPTTTPLFPNHKQLPTNISHGSSTQKPRQSLLQPSQFLPYPFPHIKPLNIPQVIVAVQYTIHHTRPPSPSQIKLAPNAFPNPIPRIISHTTTIRHGVNLTIHYRARVHPFLTYIHRTRYSLPPSNRRIEHLRPIRRSGPSISNTTADHVNLAVDNAGGGELTADAHGGASAPRVEAAVESPHVRGRDVVGETANDVDGVAEDGVGRSDGRGGHGRDGEEGVWARGVESVAMESEPLEGTGGAVGAESEVEDVLGRVKERASGEEERGREEGANGLGDEGEGGVVRTRYASKAVQSDVVWKRRDEARW